MKNQSYYLPDESDASVAMHSANMLALVSILEQVNNPQQSVMGVIQHDAAEGNHRHVVVDFVAQALNTVLDNEITVYTNYCGEMAGLHPNAQATIKRIVNLRAILDIIDHAPHEAAG